MGTTGAGKTLLLHRLMRSVLPTIGKRRLDGISLDRRALVYDAKGDVLSALHEMADCRIVTLHPFDARGAAWDMARDITSPAAALQAAAAATAWAPRFAQAGRTQLWVFGPVLVRDVPSLAGGAYLEWPDTLGRIALEEAQGAAITRPWS